MSAQRSLRIDCEKLRRKIRALGGTVNGQMVRKYIKRRATSLQPGKGCSKPRSVVLQKPPEGVGRRDPGDPGDPRGAEERTGGKTGAGQSLTVRRG